VRTSGFTPDQVRAMSGTDYANLLALYTIDPDGSERDNKHVAMQLAQVANINRRKGAPLISPLKFMLTQNSDPKTNKVKALRTAIKMAKQK
jgi:hypothetical protein